MAAHATLKNTFVIDADSEEADEAFFFETLDDPKKVVLILIGNEPQMDTQIVNANRACNVPANSVIKRQLFWIKDLEHEMISAKVQELLEATGEDIFGSDRNRGYQADRFDEIAGFSLSIPSGKVAYIIYKMHVGRMQFAIALARAGHIEQPNTAA